MRSYLRPFRASGTAPPRRPGRRRSAGSPAGCCATPTTSTPTNTSNSRKSGPPAPHLDALAGHITAFAEILTGRHGDRLDAWITAVEADDLPHLHSFAAGLKRDHAAVTNGLTLPYSSGPVEGHVNRIKMLKRQMYGRANLDLLRKRVLLAA